MKDNIGLLDKLDYHQNLSKLIQIFLLVMLISTGKLYN